MRRCSRGRAKCSATLASGDERFVNIIGAGQETVTRATRRNGEFVYTITRQGDGTVPVTCAELPGARTTTPRSRTVSWRAMPSWRRPLPMSFAPAKRRAWTTSGRSNGKAEARISDTQLRRTHTEKVDFAHMEPEARQAFLRNLNEPPQLKLSVPAQKAPTARQQSASSAEAKAGPRKRTCDPGAAAQRARRSASDAARPRSDQQRAASRSDNARPAPAETRSGGRQSRASREEQNKKAARRAARGAAITSALAGKRVTSRR